MLDWRLLDVQLEILALKEFLHLLEEQIEHVANTERTKLDEQKLSHEEWQEAIQLYYHNIEFFIPRFFRAPFLISLFAVYESAVIEVANLIKEKQLQAVSIDDLRGDFLERAKKYYSNIIKFDLYTDQKDWQAILMLSVLRNAIAHSNGRIEMLKQNVKKKITLWEIQDLGLSTNYEYIVIESKLAKYLLDTVCTSLTDLVDRYKEWDDKNKKQLD